MLNGRGHPFGNRTKSLEPVYELAGNKNASGESSIGRAENATNALISTIVGKLSENEFGRKQALA